MTPQLPVPPVFTGIFQGDIVIRSAIIEAIDELRANDWHLDYIFAHMVRDPQTKEKYGARELENAKEWFRKTRIHVLISTTITDAKFPCISILPAADDDAELTLSDTHYEPVVPSLAPQLPLSPEFSGFYDPAAGTVTASKVSVGDAVLVPGLLIVDANGIEHVITELDESTSNYIFTVDQGSFDFSRCVIKPVGPPNTIEVGSVRGRETYAIGCHVAGEPYQVTWLHSILRYCLYRHKVQLEQRGFERVTFNSSEQRQNEAFGQTNVFSRSLSLTGYFEHVWPIKFYPTIYGVKMGDPVTGPPGMSIANPQNPDANTYFSPEEDPSFVVADDDD